MSKHQLHRTQEEKKAYTQTNVATNINCREIERGGGGEGGGGENRKTLHGTNKLISTRN